MEVRHPLLTWRLREFYRFRRSAELVVNQKLILDDLTPALRGQLAYLLNDAWMSESPYFQNVTEVHNIP